MEASGLADNKQVTLGMKPAVPLSAIAAVIMFVLAYFAIELPDGIVALLVALGAGGGAAAAGPGVVVSETTEVDEGEVVFPTD